MAHNLNDLDRRTFLTLTTLGAAGAAAHPLSLFAQASPEFSLEESTIAELQTAMADGRLTARKLAEAYLARIDAFDRGGPAIHSIIELNPDALSIADWCDAERRQERSSRRLSLGPLHGIPIVIKDNIDTADKMRTSAGSLALAESIAARDAHIVKRLRESGAIVLGKTNLSEWANFRSTHSTSGWSGRGGLTRNPYALNRNACGSSSGTGAAVAANFAAVGVGTETDGSVVCPSSSSALVGIKPTVGLVSRTGIIPISHSQDTAGPMARTVTDAAILLTAMAGVDSLDAVTLKSRGHAMPNDALFLDANGLSGARIGVARGSFGFSDAVDRLMKDSIEAIRGLGATIVDPANLETQGKFDEAEFEVLLYEFKADLNTYLAGLGANVKTRTLADLIKFNEEHREQEMPYFGQELFERAQKKGPLTDADYKSALAKSRRLAGPEGIDATMKKHKLDAVIAPTGGPAWTTDLINGDHYTGGYSSASAVAGYPHITVPAGFVGELPVGISFFAAAWSEPTLLRYAYAFEQATKARKPPRFLAVV